MRRVIASFFGTGLVLGRLRGSDAGSGTVGGLGALAVSLWAGAQAGWAVQAALLVVTTVLALWAVSGLVATEGDAGWIVIDEAAGCFLATLGLTAWPAIVAFVVFRIADITKRPFPGVSGAERLPGAVGVVADDLVAGLYGLVAGQILRLIVS